MNLKQLRRAEAQALSAVEIAMQDVSKASIAFNAQKAITEGLAVPYNRAKERYDKATQQRAEAEEFFSICKQVEREKRDVLHQATHERMKKEALPALNAAEANEEFPLLPASSRVIGRILTYCEWKAWGHQVRRGEKAIGKNSKGEATFDHHQVGRKPFDPNLEG